MLGAISKDNVQDARDYLSGSQPKKTMRGDVHGQASVGTLSASDSASEQVSQ